MSDHVQSVCDLVRNWLFAAAANEVEYQGRLEAMQDMNANLGFDSVRAAAEAGHGNEYLELMERWDQ